MAFIKDKSKDGLAYCREFTRRTLKVIAEEAEENMMEGVRK
jgi:hypothetical protein